MRLRKLPVNQCWGFVLGDSLVSINVGVSTQYLFDQREHAVAAASAVGLRVLEDGAVVVAAHTKEA